MFCINENAGTAGTVTTGFVDDEGLASLTGSIFDRCLFTGTFYRVNYDTSIVGIQLPKGLNVSQKCYIKAVMLTAFKSEYILKQISDWFLSDPDMSKSQVLDLIPHAESLRSYMLALTTGSLYILLSFHNAVYANNAGDLGFIVKQNSITMTPISSTVQEVKATFREQFTSAGVPPITRGLFIKLSTKSLPRRNNHANRSRCNSFRRSDLPYAFREC
ncbi:tail fiber protein [Salmonella virus STSR3]|nr:tail fiber protein [Salmonella virus STSR3]